MSRELHVAVDVLLRNELDFFLFNLLAEYIPSRKFGTSKKAQFVKWNVLNKDNRIYIVCASNKLGLPVVPSFKV
jgi:hypothetical protein